MKNLFRCAAILGFALALSMGGATLSSAADVMMLDPAAGQDAGAMTTMEGPSDLQQHLMAQGWVNQSGSVMNFTVSSNNAIQGTYVNHASGTGCQGTPYPLSGWINGNNIAWSVAWSNTTANCNSVTAWGGFYDPASDSIKTNWVLAYQSGSGGAIQLGADVFKYQ